MSNASVNTVYAGESGPNDDGVRTGVLIATIMAALALPVISFSAFAVWAVFSWMHIRRSAIAAFLGLYTLILLLISPWFNSLTFFITAWTINVPKIVDSQGEEIIPQILAIIGRQAPLSIVIGTSIGLIYASWFWKFRRAKWEEVDFKLTPWEWYRKKKNIEDIREDKNSPLNGMTLGIDQKTGKKIIQTDIEASAHTFFVGASGAGKTTTMMIMCRDIVKRGHGLVFVDLKGDPKLAHTLKDFADRNGKTFRHWSMQSVHKAYTGPSELGPAFYDPIARGEASRRRNLLMAIKRWSEPYYESLAEEYLQKAFLVLIGNPDPNVSTLEDISALLDPKILLARSQKLIHDPKYRDIVEEIGRMNDEKISREELSAIGALRVDMKNLTHNVIGPWLKKDPSKLNDINLKDVADNNEVILFSLDSSNYGKESSVLGNLIIQDLKTVSSELRENPSEYPLHIFIDEFSAIGSDNIIQLINKCRDAGIPVSLSTQSLGDLRKVDETFLDQLLGIINAFAIHRTNTEEDAEVYAGLTGRTVRQKFRQNVEHTKNWFGMGKGAGSGAGIIEDVEEYIITVPELQGLTVGEMIYVSKFPQKIERVTVIPERKVFTTPDRKMGPAYTPPKAIKESSYNEFVPHSDENSAHTKLVTLEKESEEGEQRIEVRKSDPAKLEKIFNRPTSEFINEKRIPEYSKHIMPPQKVVPVPTQAPSKPQNLTPPVFTLPARVAVKKEEPAPVEQIKTVEPVTVPQTTPKIEVKKDDIKPNVERKKNSIGLPSKDKFDF